jgi:hypothetical protein
LIIMANDVHTGADASVTTLVSGIIHDAEDLFKQQLHLLKHEVRADMRKTVAAALSLVVGAFVLATGAFLLGWMLVYLLQQLTELELWACFGIVGGTLAVIGAILCYVGKLKFDSFNPLPDETAEALKENVQWITKPK